MSAPPARVLACTARHPLPGGAVHLLGALRTVTGAATLVELGSSRVLVDCGIAQGRAARSWSPSRECATADAVVLTHGHNDHVGGLPELIESGWSGPIWSTPATAELTRLVLADSLRLRGRTRARARTLMARLEELQSPARYGVGFKPASGVEARVTFREAGHILGSASVELESEGARLICSGDIGRPGTPILRDPFTAWSEHRPVDLVVMESTYGDRDHPAGPEVVRDRLKALVLRALEDGGHILVPAFAIGRTQSLLYHLNDLAESGELPEDMVLKGEEVANMWQAVKSIDAKHRAVLALRYFDELSYDEIAQTLFKYSVGDG